MKQTRLRIPVMRLRSQSVERALRTFKALGLRGDMPKPWVAAWVSPTEWITGVLEDDLARGLDRLKRDAAEPTTGRP